MQFRLFGHLCLAFTFFFFLSACGGPGKPIRYDPNPPAPGAQALPLKVAVVELEDNNPAGFEYPTPFGCPALIPGFFYGTCKVKYRPTSFGKCLAKELKHGKVYQSVDYYQNWEEISTTHQNYDLILSGRLNHDRVTELWFLYGLSLPGDILWLVGFPANSLSREVSFEVDAFTPTQPRSVLMTEKISFDESSLFGIWYHHGKHFSNLGRGDYVREDPADDFCTTEYLQPQYLSLRQKLKELQLPSKPMVKDRLNPTMDAQEETHASNK